MGCSVRTRFLNTVQYANIYFSVRIISGKSQAVPVLMRYRYSTSILIYYLGLNYSIAQIASINARVNIKDAKHITQKTYIHITKQKQVENKIIPTI